LTSITVESGNSRYDSRDNCNAIIDGFDDKLIAGCQNTIIPNSVTEIDNFAFLGCSNLTSLIIPESVTSIGRAAFDSCTGLTSVSIPNSVTEIGGNAFMHCSGLTDVTIGSSVTYIGSSAFDDCLNLTDVYSYITDVNNVSIGAYPRPFFLYSEDYSNRTLYVPKGTAGDYQANENWYPYFGTIVEMGAEVVLPGDVDGNGMIGIGDVAGIIDLILAGNATIEDNPAADANGDGIINIVDVTHLIDIILYPNN